eukprot:2347463-Pyramimonas_sp.AAC.2
MDFLSAGPANGLLDDADPGAGSSAVGKLNTAVCSAGATAAASTLNFAPSWTLRLTGVSMRGPVAIGCAGAPSESSS